MPRARFVAFAMALGLVLASLNAQAAPGDRPTWSKNDRWSFTGRFWTGSIWVPASGTYEVGEVEPSRAGPEVYDARAVTYAESHDFGSTVSGFGETFRFRTSDLALVRHTYSGAAITYDVSYNPPVPPLPFPLTVGKQWDTPATAILNSGTGPSGPVTFRGQVTSEADVTLPVVVSGETQPQTKTFRCAVVRIPDDAGTGYTDYYYSADIGWYAKVVHRTGGTPDATDREMNVTSYKYGKPFDILEFFLTSLCWLLVIIPVILVVIFVVKARRDIRRGVRGSFAWLRMPNRPR